MNGFISSVQQYTLPQLFSLLLLLGATVQVSAEECSSELTIPRNQWHQISLPCDPGEANTVSHVFSDDITGIYGQDWVVFRYDANQSRYVNVGESGILQMGIGYWLVQNSMDEATLDISGSLATEILNTDVSQCPATPGRCAKLSLVSNNNVNWNMAGFPLISRLGLKKISIATETGICSDTDGCDVSEAHASNVFSDSLWHYDGAEYRQINGNAPIHPWDGFWTATLSDSVKPKLLLPINYGGYDPVDPGIAAFQTVSDKKWDETAVRKVMHAFAYGGQATAEQIEAWANLSPERAIIEILTFDEFNPLLSPPAPGDIANLGEKGGTLRDLGLFWSSDDPDNDVDEEDRYIYNVLADVGNTRTDLLWERAVLSRGTNPFRQKIGLWETNYHLAVNRDVGVRERAVLQYYDDISNSLKNDGNYATTLTRAALSVAIAKQYGHDKNIFSGDECECNEDFAREFHQLFFGILGTDNPDYHETVTIKNTAKALTDMHVDDAQEVITFGTSQHYPGNLEILNTVNSGNRASERIPDLSTIAIEHSESLAKLPELIINGLANDNLSQSEISEIRDIWQQMPEKNLLHFLRGYAISEQFHHTNRVKFLSSLDRHVSIYMQTVLNNFEINLYDAGLRFYKDEDVKLFRPRHNVFGGQTGLEASNNSEIFRANYNRSTKKYTSLFQSAKGSHNWKKKWISAIPATYTKNYLVDKVGEFLWNRYIGDGLKNYGVLERTYINALLATNRDWVMEVDPDNLGRTFTTTELTTDNNLIDLRAAHASSRLNLDSEDPSELTAANAAIGKVINFIVATPFIFAQQGR